MTNQKPTLIILSAGQGTRLRPLTNTTPKGLVNVGGKSIIKWQIETARKCGIEDIVIVTGFYGSKIRYADCVTVRNKEYKTTNMLYSLMQADKYFKSSFIMSYADIIYEPRVFESLLSSPHDTSVVVDRDFLPYWQARNPNPIEDLESLKISDNKITSIGQKPLSLDEIEAQYIGLVKFQNNGIKHLLKTIHTFSKTVEFRSMYITDILHYMIRHGYTLTPVITNAGWLEIDNLKDKHLAENVISNSNGTPQIERHKAYKW